MFRGLSRVRTGTWGRANRVVPNHVGFKLPTRDSPAPLEDNMTDLNARKRYFVGAYYDGDHKKEPHIIRLRVPLADLALEVEKLDPDICCFEAWDSDETIVMYRTCRKK